MNQQLKAPHVVSTTALPLLILGNGDLAKRLGETLTQNGTAHLVAYEVPEDVRQYSGAVLALDSVDRNSIEAIAAYFLHNNCPCLPVLMMGEVAQIGPVMRTNPAGACVLCADTRMNAMTGRAALDAAWPMSQTTCDIVVRQLAKGLEDWSEMQGRYLNRISFHWENGSETAHHVMRTVACQVCAEHTPHMPFRDPIPFLVDPAVVPDQQLILRLEDQLVDPLTGPLKSVAALEMPADVPAIHHVVAQLVDPGWVRSGIPVLDCGGNELDPTHARAAAMGEAIERACASEVWPGHLTYGSWQSLKDKAVHPRAFDLFHADDRKRDGFPYSRILDDTPLHWIWGTDLSTSASVLVPASRVFVPFDAPQPEPAMDYPLLSGFAAGASRESALLSALLEVIERDSFMIAWGNQLSLQPVNLADSGPLAQLSQVFAAADIMVRVGLVQLDLGAPVALAMAKSTNPSQPAMVVAAAAALTPARACEKALSELTANWLNVAGTLATTPVPDGPEPALIRDETAHGLLYARQDMASKLDFWWDSGVPEMTLSEPTRDRVNPGIDCQYLTSAMARAGVSPIVIDLTMPAVSDLGLYTVKVVAPGSYPMNFDALWPHLGGQRMRTAPVVAGLRSAPTPQHKLARTPHPFP